VVNFTWELGPVFGRAGEPRLAQATSSRVSYWLLAVVWQPLRLPSGPDVPHHRSRRNRPPAFGTNSYYLCFWSVGARGALGKQLSQHERGVE
jgi:hypothetical protein